ncbi:NADPH-dependent 7-cyano-7-deazaguanine reductase QueF [Zhongshania guokunii]|uniref:NADPH-dependent 7-cyano-7-deazaguanine reductase n=1 Tax=Zhongshania guokunii TaxID=641783 RepID=A0ABV3UA33_9GAMM
MSEHHGHGPLGAKVDYPAQYDASCLYPIPRAAGRAALGIAADLPFVGVDIWNAYELSWLNLNGKPMVACAEFRVPADSENIIESKSFKLYLNSFNQTRLGGIAELSAVLTKDLSAAAGAPVQVEIACPDDWGLNYVIQNPAGECLDSLDISPDSYQPNSMLLKASEGESVTEELYSHLLRSRCPVTSQPDWASIEIAYSGARIDREGLLAYLISFREHDDFHEQCVEQIFSDINRYCQPTSLRVYARYLRRGGLDINPWRSNVVNDKAYNSRGSRQ